MGKGLKTFVIFVLIVFGIEICQLKAQTYTASGNIVAQPIPDRTVIFNISDEGESKPITWGLDLAWLSEENIIRGIGFMGKENVDVIRSSFMPTNPLVGDTALQGNAFTNTNLRINIIRNNLGTGTKVVLNCDHPSVNSYFVGNASNWANLIDITARMHERQGLKVVSVSPFNEPDYGWGQGTIQDFYKICLELDKNPHYDSIRISGGNTLNCDEALGWYKYLNEARLDEGNTHQLAGSFNSFANFFEAVRANGDHATDDELHNVMEAMVGVEYGLQTGIWWGTAEYARGEFCKASDGVRLGYAEHRPNWTAASVYRAPDGKVQAFGGTSERQAATTIFRFFSKDRDVYFDGYGPQREYTMVMPGGTGYQQGQTNAERVVNITWGEDIQPVIDGKYMLVNRASGKVLEVAGGSNSAGANVQQGTSSGVTYQLWNVTPVSSRIGGDFSYFTFKAAHSGKALDVYNWSLSDSGNLIVWDDAKGNNQQWYLEYAEDGWFYIRSRHSSLCVEVASASMASGANVQQSVKDGATNQQWRFISAGATVEFEQPGAPTDLIATANSESILLEWTASPDDDVAGYTVFRAEASGGPYNTIARNIQGTSFLDNSATTTHQYFYVIKAVDNSLNSSVYSDEISAKATNNPGFIAYFPFDRNIQDTSINLNHGASRGGISYAEGRFGPGALAFNNSNTFVQLPSTIAYQEKMTIACWVYWKGGAPLQRIFDFSNDEDETMYLTTSTSLLGGKLQFVMRNGGEEQVLNAPLLPLKEWTHVAVTLNSNEARMYINGELADESDEFSIRPIDFRPALNYIGRGQSKEEPLLNGRIDDFVLYNYALPADEITEIYTSGVLPTSTNDVAYESISTLSVWPIPANDFLHISYVPENNSAYMLSIVDMKGRLVYTEEMVLGNGADLDVSNLPSGVYALKLINRKESIYRKIIIE